MKLQSIQRNYNLTCNETAKLLTYSEYTTYSTVMSNVLLVPTYSECKQVGMYYLPTYSKTTFLHTMKKKIPVNQTITVAAFQIIVKIISYFWIIFEILPEGGCKNKNARGCSHNLKYRTALPFRYLPQLRLPVSSLILTYDF